MRIQTIIHIMICNVLLVSSLHAFPAYDSWIMSPYAWVIEKYNAYQNNNANTTCSNIIQQLTKGKIPVADIQELDLHQVDSNNLFVMLDKLNEVLDIKLQRNEIPQSEHISSSNTVNRQISHLEVAVDNSTQHKTFNAESIKDHTLQSVCRWVRKRFYSTHELPLESCVDMTMLQYAAEDIEALINWLSQPSIGNYSSEHKQQTMINNAQNCLEAIRAINANTYSASEIPRDASTQLPLRTRWSMRNRSISRATNGIVTIPRMIGVTLAAGIGYGIYHYTTS